MTTSDPGQKTPGLIGRGGMSLFLEDLVRRVGGVLS